MSIGLAWEPDKPKLRTAVIEVDDATRTLGTVNRLRALVHELLDVASGRGNPKAISRAGGRRNTWDRIHAL